MPRNVYFSHGTRSEQLLLEDLIIESLSIFGNEFYYIPRTLVAKDNILGEDRLSQFKSSYPIEAYFEDVDNFSGQGAFMQKFGLMMEQSATLTVARRRWDQLVGRYGTTIIPVRPCEGDLMYFPLTKGLFEIKFVQHQDPFYQLGKLYVYKLQIELFQYASERLDTGISEVDVFESLKTQDINDTESYRRSITDITIIDGGSGYDENTTITITASRGYGAEAKPIITDGKITAINIINGGLGYMDHRSILVSAVGSGSGALLKANVELDIDRIQSYGDNNSFKKEAEDIIFDVSNPFGE